MGKNPQFSKNVLFYYSVVYLENSEPGGYSKRATEANSVTILALRKFTQPSRF